MFVRARERERARAVTDCACERGGRAVTDLGNKSDLRIPAVFRREKSKNKIKKRKEKGLPDKYLDFEKGLTNILKYNLFFYKLTW